MSRHRKAYVISYRGFVELYVTTIVTSLYSSLEILFLKKCEKMHRKGSHGYILYTGNDFEHHLAS